MSFQLCRKTRLVSLHISKVPHQQSIFDSRLYMGVFAFLHIKTFVNKVQQVYVATDHFLLQELKTVGQHFLSIKLEMMLQKSSLYTEQVKMLWFGYCWSIFNLCIFQTSKILSLSMSKKNHRTIKVKQNEGKSMSGGCDLGNEHQILEANSKVIQFLLNITGLCYPYRSNEMTAYQH